MFKKINNLHLLFLVGIVSLLSVLLIQRYVDAQSAWIDPDSLPGVTPNNTFVLNPLTDNLDIGTNDKSIIGDDVILDGGGTEPALTVTNGRKICFGSTSPADCLSTWPTVAGGVTKQDPADVNYLTMFASVGASPTITNSPLYYDPDFLGTKTIVMGSISSSLNTNTSQLRIQTFGNNGGNPLLYLANNTGGSDMLSINDRGGGKSIRIVKGDASTGQAIHIGNTGTGESIYVVDQAGDNTPFVLDDTGYLGIGTPNPNRQLHVKTLSGNAEIDIQSGDSSTHWGIYQNFDDGALRFWNTNDRLVIDANGRVGIATNSPSATLEVDGDVLITGDLDVYGTATGNGGLLWSSGNDGHNSGLDADTVDGKHDGELNAQYLDGYEMQIIDDGAGGANPQICVKSGNCNYSSQQCNPRNSVTIKSSCNTTADCNSVCANLNPANFSCNYNCNGNYPGCDTNQTDHIWGSVQCTSVSASFCLDSSEYPPVGACVCSFSAPSVSYGRASISSTWFCADTIAQ